MAKKTNVKKEVSAPTLQFIELSSIVVGKLNPRKTFDQGELDELINSVRELGVIQPITVRPKGDKFELVCGERRYRASLAVQTALKDRTTIPASVRELTDQQAMEMMVTENLQRKDVHPLEEADAFLMMKEKMSYSITDIAAKIGKVESYVVRRLQLLSLADEIKTILKSGELGIGHAELLARIDVRDQNRWLEEKYHARWSDGAGTINDLRNWLKTNSENNLSRATFSRDDVFEGKNFVCPTCSSCPLNSANNPTLFPDQATEAICHDARCFMLKIETTFEKNLEIALADPAVLLIAGYSHDKTSQKLISDGHNVLRDYHDYSLFNGLRKPDEPVMNDYDREDYDSDEELQEDFDSDMVIYKNDLAEYELELEKFKNGEHHSKRAFVVSGNNKGQYAHIVLKETRSASSAALSPQDDKKAQISKINDKLKRGRELDNEKIMKKLVDQVKSLPLLKSTTTPPFDIDHIMLVLFAYEHSGSSKEINAALGLSEHFYSYSGGGDKLIEAIKNSSEEVKAAIIRKAVFNKFQNISHSGISWYVLNAVADHWCPDEVNRIRLDQEGIRDRREAKLNKQLEDLGPVKFAGK